jgi:hypothetical protein
MKSTRCRVRASRIARKLVISELHTGAELSQRVRSFIYARKPLFGRQGKALPDLRAIHAVLVVRCLEAVTELAIGVIHACEHAPARELRQRGGAATRGADAGERPSPPGWGHVSTIPACELAGPRRTVVSAAVADWAAP